MTLRVVIAGGGTGGHLFPGIALAEEFATRHSENDVLFVGTRRGIEREAVPRAGFPIEFIEVRGIKRMSLWARLRALLQLPVAIFQSWRILRRYDPGIVIAVGGYASGPVALAAWLRRVPVVVQEQNALPGLTSRVVGRFARRVFLAFEEAIPFFRRSKVLVTGNPIRQALLENFLRPTPHRDREHPKVLVFGGSQGARALNEAMVGAVPLVAQRFPGLRVLHQTGAAAREEVEAAYARAPSGAEVEVREFIHDMSSAYAEALVVVCRAGATTVAELAVCRRAAILVPFPYAADDHQTVNARALADKGAAILLPESELSPERLAREIVGLLEDPDRLARMEQAAGLIGHPEAAKEIADACVEVWMETGGFEREARAQRRREKREGRA